ncbi:MAG: cadherin-like domain-containing protein [Pirellulales bacterium]
MGSGIQTLEDRVLLAVTVVDFDAVNANFAPVSGAALANYLDDFGITISNTTNNITPVIANENNPPQGFHVAEPSSPPNFFITNNANNEPYSYRINFASPLMRFAFTRIQENGGANMTVAEWRARALDSSGVTVDTLGEGEHSGIAKQERQFALEGESIVAVIFERTSSTAAGLNAVPLDDWVLTDAIDQRPVANDQTVTTTVNTAINISLTATDPDNDPLTFTIVSFPSHGALSGTAPNVRYTPANGYVGPDSFTFQASDGDGDSNIATVRITVNAPNGNPVITTNTGSTVARGGTDTITSAELNTTDSNNGPAELIYVVTRAPLNGTLLKGGSQVTSFRQSEINSNLVTYVHNSSQTASDNFIFSVSDGTTTLSNNTFNFTVTGVSGAPVITTNTGSSVGRSGTDFIAPTELVTTDSNTPADQLIYTVTTAPAQGTLRLNGNLTSSFTQADINNFRVTYSHGGSQTASDSFRFSVSDGTTTLPNNTFNITVTGVSGAPVVTTNTGSTVAQGGIDVISSTELRTTDSNTGAGQLVYNVTAGPANGTLRLSGSPTTTFTQADIDAGRITYVHNSSQTTSDSFQFSVSDGTTPVSGTFTITITGTGSGVPVISRNTGSTVTRSGTDFITSTELATTDSNTPAEQLFYTVTTPPARGILRVNGVFTNSFTQADINANRLTYQHDGSQIASDSFVFRVTDGTTTLHGNTFHFTVTGVSGAPVVTTNTGSTVARGGSDPITSGELATTDSNTGPEQLFYTVTAAPLNGTLLRSGSATTTFTQGDINAGRITYVHNSSQTTSDSFQFSVSDGTTPVSGTFTITVSGVSGAPVITTNAGSVVTRGDSDLIAFTELNTTDTNTPPAQLTYTVTAGPANGTLRRSGSATTTFTQADIDSGLLSYIHNGGLSGADSFGFNVSDGTTILSGNTFTITVAGVSGAPAISANTGSTATRGETDVITPSELNTTDSNTGPGQLVYTVTTAPANGTLRRGTSQVTTFTQADINNGLVTYVPNNSQATSDSFGFSVSDGTTTLPGNTFRITIAEPGAGQPMIVTNTGSRVTRGGIDVIEQTELNTTDSNTVPGQLMYTITTAPVNGTLRLNGVTTTTFTQADINARRVTYFHNGGPSTSDSFQFNVSDGSNILVGHTFTFTVGGGGNPPTIVTNTGSTVAEGRTDVITSSELNTTDPDDTAAQLVYTVTFAPANGTLRLSGSPTTTFTQADINASRVTYLHNGSETTSDSFTFRVSDGGTVVGPATFLMTVTPVDDAVVTLDNGRLNIETDDRDDIVTITGVGAGTGAYTIVVRQGNASAQTFSVAGVNRDIFVNLHGGNDRLTINNALVGGSLDIQMEDGNDLVTLGDQDVVSTRDQLRVDLGAGDDTLDGKRLFIGTDQLVHGGDGDDRLIFEGFASPVFTLGTSAAGLAFWSGGAGNDIVRVTYGFIVRSWGVFLGDGADQLNVFGSAVSGDVLFSGDAGNDTLTVDTNFFDATFVMNALAGADTVFLANGLGTEFASMAGGDGNDQLTVRNQTTKHLQIEGGAGADEADVQSSALDRFFATLGTENDELTIRGNLVQLETDLDGGAGEADRLIDLGNTFRGASRRRGFELLS